MSSSPCMASISTTDHFCHSLYGAFTCKYKLAEGENIKERNPVYFIVRLFVSFTTQRRQNGPLTRYTKLRVAHAPGMPATFPRHRLQRKPLVSDPDMHHGTCMTHVPWCMSGSLNRGGGEKVPGIPGAMRNPQNYVSGERPMPSVFDLICSLSHDPLHTIFIPHMPTQ